jgi:hypothetical protein
LRCDLCGRRASDPKLAREALSFRHNAGFLVVNAGPVVGA